MEQQAENQDLQLKFAATADPQLSSDFFAILPPEVRRMIYVEIWRNEEPPDPSFRDIDHRVFSSIGDEEAFLYLENKTDGLKQHIIKYASGRYTHSPCIVADQTGYDRRMVSMPFSNAPGAVQKLDRWANRTEHSWAVHWPCDEFRKKRGRPPSPFFPALQTCKLLYLEGIQSIYSTVTFVFTDMMAAQTFISARPPSTFRSIELCFRTQPILPELYYPNTLQNGPQPSISRQLSLNVHNNPWARLCETLRACTALHRLNIWFDIKDLRPWQHRVYERRFFDALFSVRTSGPGNSFILALPQLGGHRVTRHKLPRVEDFYLEGENLGGAPFVVKRGLRPNYWMAHLAKVQLRNADADAVLTIDAGPAYGGP